MTQYELVLQGFDGKTGKTVSQPMDFIVAGQLQDAMEDIRKHYKWPDAVLLSLKIVEPA
jgi:hypothetical protein